MSTGIPPESTATNSKNPAMNFQINPQRSIMKPMWKYARLSVLAFAMSGGALAQTVVPDAGSLRQQIEQERGLPPLPSTIQPPRVAPPPAIKPQKGMTVSVKQFRFAGNTLLGAEQLAPAVAGFLDRPIGFAELQLAADAVAAAYREAGWIVRVYLPEQDISEGVVTLQVIEAVFGGLRLDGELSKRVARSDIEGYFQARQQVGQPLSSADLDRALLLADDLPGVSVAGTLVPGREDGETALLLQTTDEPLFFYGELGLDNTGARSIGSGRLTANLNLNSPSRHGEWVNLNLLHSEGSDYARLALTIPYGYDGLRLGINGSAMVYKVIDGPSAGTAAQIEGDSGSLGLDLSYPLIRSRMHNLYLTAGVDNKTFYTRDSLVRSDYESNTARLALSGNRFDNLGGGGANSASLQLSGGRLSEMREHTLLNSIDRGFLKLDYSLSRQQTVTPDHAVLVSLMGQHATQVLDSSEKFYIGGANSVRAYPASELGGDRGQ
jgi:hemolysin activation/secretion protein